MVCQRQLLSCRAYKFSKQSSSTSSCNRAGAAQIVSPLLPLRSLCQSSRRHIHLFRRFPNLANTLSVFKRTKHHSAIASSQAARKGLLKLKQREDIMASNETASDPAPNGVASTPKPEGNASTTTNAGSVQDPKDTFTVAFESNSHWRRNLAELKPELFKKLGQGQSPEILWIGCADSRCPETTILGLQPGDIFCHRNIANILVPTDLNSLSVIQYAVQYLKVKHIIVCGHTSCGGIAAALANKKLGLIDTWLMPLRHLRAQNASMLEALSEKERGLKMVDLNVRRSVSVLLENPIVIENMVERGMQVHGVIYDVGSGELNELDITEDDDIVEARKKAFKVEE